MDLKEAAEELCNTETEEGTVALHKKRSRRVSFAENTSVHIYDRDEEYETPPDLKPSSAVNPYELGQSTDDLGLGFHQESSDANESKESSQNEEEDEEDTHEIDSGEPFLRLVESPSSGSIIGSATSSDDFFGPVSVSLIRPGRLSDSASSEENHDVTKDSTFFSMHFRSLARSDSGGDLKTSPGVHLSFEEKTPTQDSIPTNLGNSMVLTVAKKPDSRSSMPTAILSSGKDSNDMSLVGETMDRYDFGRLSPDLDALLAEGSKVLHALSISDNISVSESIRNMEGNLFLSKEQEGSLMDLCDDGDKETDRINTHDMLTEGMPVGKSEESVKDAFEMRRPGLDFSAFGYGTLSNLDEAHQIEGFTQQEYRSPLAGFISSSKRRQILLDTASPSKSPWILTPSQKQTDSFVRNESIRHGRSASSIQKSISKLTMLEASPFPSTPNSKIDNSNLRALDYLFKTLPLKTVSERNSKDPQVKHVDGSGIETPLDTCSKEQLLSVGQEKGEQGSLINMDDNRIEIPKDIGDVGHTEESTSLVKKGERSPHHVSAGTLCTYQPINVAAAAALPSHLTRSREKMQPNLLTSVDHTEGALVTSETNSFLPEITPHKIVSSLEKRLEMESLTSPEYQSSLSRELRLHVQHKELVSSIPGQVTVSRGNVINASTSNDKLDLMLMEKTGPPITEINYFKGLTEVEMMGYKEINLHDQRDKSGTMGNFSTPVRDKDSQNFQSTSPGRNFQTGRDLARVENDLPGGGIKADSCGSTSPFARRSADEQSFQKNLLEWFTQSPSRRELCNVTHDENIHSVVAEDVRSPKSQMTNGFKNSSARKRRNEEIILRDRDHMDEIARTQRSLKLHKGGICDSEFLERQNESNSGPSTSGHELKHWADIYSKLSGVTKQLLSSSIDKLNFCAVDVLEDILVHLWRSNKYEMLCTHIQSQKTFDPHSNVPHKRVAEARLLLHRIVHEQLKLQLMRVKRDRLMQKVQLLSSGIQDTQMLKLNYLPRLSRHFQVDDGHPQPSEDIQEVACDQMTAMGQALEASEKKIMNFTNFFHTSIKMKREPGCANTIVLVNEHLVKRTRCRFIRMESQLWVVDNLESTNDHHNVVLNYLGFNIQRLKVTVGPVSSISISNKLNDMNITQNLPDMDACTAFAFVLNAETTQKYVGPRSLAQETQISSSLLGNLLDVVEEVQQARIELRNLSRTSFHSPSAEQLDLQLCFFDFMSGRKAILTLDISCLKRGVYPSDILPSQMAVPRAQNSFSQPLFAEIRAAVQSLRAGYFRIIRLCRCISQVLQAGE